MPDELPHWCMVEDHAEASRIMGEPFTVHVGLHGSVETNDGRFEVNYEYHQEARKPTAVLWANTDELNAEQCEQLAEVLLSVAARIRSAEASRPLSTP